MTFIVRPDRDEEETRAAVETVIGRVESTGGDVVATAPWNPPAPPNGVPHQGIQ